ncbi:MAG TPA: iron-sulfur cluster assembly scaffold protein [Clostridiales bacterium]|nr:iron-sulfur cluster assembly scaffold protein [Clostridiales bacterium]HQP69256.1 iron-sulfur cluster assembly scaffold protein [Clostridiales bacterium]
MYSQKYIEHFSNPKNIGSIPDPDAACNVVNTEGGCFDNVDVTVKIENGVITELKYKLKACSGTITVFSLLSEIIVGKTPEELDMITFDKISDLLGGMPEKKHHSIRLALEAVEKIKKEIINK